MLLLFSGIMAITNGNIGKKGEQRLPTAHKTVPECGKQEESV